MDKDKNFQNGIDEFQFPNGDRYLGGYWAHRTGVVWRDGQGIYITHDGQLYEAEWKDDKLNEQENVQITFKNEDRYIGRIAKFKYNGPGTYFFKNGCRLTANFTNNKPSGELILIDHRDNCWYGRADEESTLLFTEHVFSYELDSERGKGAPKYPKQEQEESVTPESIEEIDMKELEREVFHKSKKTPANIDFYDSEWFRNYEEFMNMCERVFPKVAEGGITNLDEEEFTWYEKFKQTLKKIRRMKKKRLPKINCDLLKQFYSEEYQKSCPPVRVFYPTQLPEQVEQQ